MLTFLPPSPSLSQILPWLDPPPPSPPLFTSLRKTQGFPYQIGDSSVRLTSPCSSIILVELTLPLLASLFRLQSPLTNSHLSRPTLQTLFPPTTSSYQINLTSLTQLAKLDARLASLQSTFDALLSADEERTDEEMILLEIKRDALMRVGERWRVSLGAIEAVGEMVELEGGGGEAER